MSKIIEEAAFEYAYEAAQTTKGALAMADSRDITALKRAFLTGANFALANQWRSVEDELPKVNTPILGRKKNRIYVCAYDGEDFYNESSDKLRPTHFMYIPSLDPEQR